MGKGLQFRYGIIMASLVVLVAITLGSFLLFQYTSNFKAFSEDSRMRTEVYLLEQVERRGLSLITILGENLKNPLYDLDMASMFRLLLAINESPGVKQAIVYDDAGKVIHDGIDTIPSFGELIADGELKPSNMSPDRSIVTELGEDSLVLWHGIFIGERVFGGVMLELSLDTIKANLARLDQQYDEQYENSLQRTFLLVITTTLALVLLGILLAVYSANRVVDPIKKVAHFASEIKAQKYQQKLEYDRNDEIGELVDSFNAMSVELEEETRRRAQTEVELKQLALYDPLTNLPNRNLILTFLKTMIGTARRNDKKLAVMFLDMDDFKKVNDTLGHDVGDELLVDLSHRLNEEIRSSDQLGRLGGDEFILLAEDLTETQNAGPIAQKILDVFAEPFKLSGREVSMTASVGIAIFPDDGETESELLQKADSAMYHSKSQGRNTFSYFTEEMNLGVARRLAIEEQLRQAIGHKEFNLVYQPKVDLRDDSTVGVEALLRWENPILGAVSPDEFIPVSEKSGMIKEMGRFVFNRAVEEMSSIGDSIDGKFEVAINISPRQFDGDGDLDDIVAMLDECRSAPVDVELEITEGVLMSGIPDVGETLQEIRNAGARIAMDDFGTGYSSLNYLREFAFDTLKIDRSFIVDIETNSKHRSLIENIIQMAHGLELTVIAEGVETAEQVAFLKKAHCDFAQGYYFSRPLSPDALKTYMRINSRRELVH